jgi:elongation factor P
MQINCGEIRTGMKIELDGDVWHVVSAEHYKREQRRAVIRAKLKSLSTGRAREETFRVNDSVEQAEVDMRDMQYLYPEGDMLVLMDNETYDQIHLPREAIGEQVGFLKEGTTVKVAMHDGRAIDIELPPKVDLRVVETPPAVKGDTVQNATKAAVMETGVTVQVPMFINENDMVRVSTRDGSYVERA